jgi:hypothetical protein
LSLAIGFSFFFQVHDRPLQPYTIVDLEFAWTPGRVAPMLAAWGLAGAQTARESLWIDFGFIPAYALFVAGGTLLAARAAKERWQTFGLWLALAPFFAGALDAIENACLLSALSSTGSPDMQLLVAGLAASIKFVIVLFLCPAYVLSVAGMYLKSVLVQSAVKKE